MTYADNPDITQADYDRYYQERYGFGVEDMAARQRQQNRAQMINTLIADKNALIVDFGGVGIVSAYLKDYGFTNVEDIGAGDNLPLGIDALLAEHVLEHIYDLPAAMRNISASMKEGSTLIIDGPESSGIAEKKSTPMLDWHQKHINHFAYYDYMHLGRLHGFEFCGSATYVERENPCLTMMFGKAKRDYIATASIGHISIRMGEMVEKLKKLGDRKLVVWGCGDIAMHVLSIHFPNIKYFVDKDPALYEAVIKGRWVMRNVVEGETDAILVIAQGQKQSILDSIRDEGLTNEVIVL
jgi:hypothetical protein